MKDSTFENRLFINGEFVPSQKGKTFELINPATTKVLGSVYEADIEDVDVAVAAGKAAFGFWSELPAFERSRWLHRLVDKVEQNMQEISRLEALTMGKPVHNDISILIGIQVLRYFASRPSDIQGETSLSDPGLVGMTLRQPYGVVGAIIPWNTPFSMLCLKVGPALAAGNTMVLKTSEKSPVSSLIVGQCMKEIGFPPGVLNILSGFGRPCGEAIAKHMEIRKLAFTGSTATGRAIKKAAAESNLKTVTLELGGKSPLIVFADADIQKAAEAAAASILVVSGQTCMASSRVYVEESIANQFVELMKLEMSRIGASANPLTSGTLRGPQADRAQYDRVMSFLDLARAQDVKTLLGGDRENKDGYYIQPTMLFQVPEDSKLVKEEIFGPVVCVNTFTNEADAIGRANDTEYGLYGSFFTKDMSRALRLSKKIEAGTVGVNIASPNVMLDMPFGGWKQSGEGRELGKHSLDSWTELKTVLMKL
ncbi:uncharacterized protein A1O9_11740 [Exophiala aquamarina CBS 119918]|uniref:aldehyde dehydrogenase (NAD(+)) n=1 Tax=Exophiala aquamarina CBS 119918 TaxID=1182545 RepID=A0A072NW49_9EURO|nr:uncharacterized protein A1O9_11740 [Exophiala aquamarina CBS 119918]KEF52114.1 hypothetical protein A1O9_11740 [Exophiala aquamarina CBS 119918]